MFNQFYNWLTQRFHKSSFALLKKVARSMERDKNVPLGYILRKAWIFLFSMLTAPFNLRKCDRVGQRPRTRHRPHIENMGRIAIGDDININSRNVQTDLVSGPDGVISIGDSVSINFGVSIVAQREVKIGSRVRIGPYTMIYDSNQHVHGHRYKKAAGTPVVIEDDVWVASRVIILEGSRIGKGSLIASGSIVSGLVPPYVVAAGSPARVVKFLDSKESSGFMWERRNMDHPPKLNEHLLNRVRDVACGVWSGKDGELSLDRVFHDQDAEWDSFQQVKFINALENEFNVTFDKEELTQMKNIRKTACIIHKHINEGYGLKMQKR